MLHRQVSVACFATVAASHTGRIGIHRRLEEGERGRQGRGPGGEGEGAEKGQKDQGQTQRWQRCCVRLLPALSFRVLSLSKVGAPKPSGVQVPGGSTYARHWRSSRRSCTGPTPRTSSFAPYLPYPSPSRRPSVPVSSSRLPPSSRSGLSYWSGVGMGRWIRDGRRWCCTCEAMDRQ